MPNGAAQADRAGDLTKLDNEQSRRLLIQRFQLVRQQSLKLVAPLSNEDMVIQSMPDVSPSKWHLAHVTWFFETFVLERFEDDFKPHHPAFRMLFNSYYVTVGDRHARPKRGLLSRPPVEEILAYRQAIDERIASLLQTSDDFLAIAPLIELGVNHEQQHQELLLMDIKHVLAQNPLLLGYGESTDKPEPGAEQKSSGWSEFEGGIRLIGRGDQQGFCFDNETPQNRQFLNPFALANRPVTNSEFAAFIADDGYRRPELWLSDGWDQIQQQNWNSPLYWQQDDGRWQEFTLNGLAALDGNAPVCHISYYEADAYARWAKARLPSEVEWETAAQDEQLVGNLLDSDQLHPGALDGEKLAGMTGAVWEWTSSAYAAYPGYQPPAGALGEYNGKFMANQYVLRGGCCVTPDDHIRKTYRNFFYPHMRWQFAGLRLAKDL